MLIGTPQYMSPEQALGRELGPGTDLFSLGVVLHELVTGQRPFLGRTVGETINNIVNQPAPALGLENPVFSPALDQIISKCLEKAPEHRYASAQELVADLRKVKETSDRALAAPTQDLAKPAGDSAADKSRPTALWQLAGKLNAGRSPVMGWTLGIVLLALLAAGGWVLWRGREPKPLGPAGTQAPMAQQKSLAVLPFANLSADKADEYLSDGMTEELVNVLAKLPGLRVPGRSSSFAFKGANEADLLHKVGEQLKVGAVLEGSVRKAGNRLRITAQLINVSDGFQLWSETYDRDMTDILDIESDVARQVSAALELRLGITDTQRLAQRPTENLEAYSLYLQGRNAWNLRTGESLLRAVDLFTQATAKDPGFALAYAGLADCYAVLPNYDTSTATRETQAKARAAALKALELSPHLAAPLAALASLKEDYDWDWPGAEADYRRAIELDPTYSTARQWFAESLSVQGRHDEAVREARKAVELDPLSRVINTTLASVLGAAGRREESIRLLRKRLAADPSFALAHLYLGRALVSEGNLTEAVTELETAERLDPELALGYLGFCYAKTGRTEDAQRVLQRLEQRQSQGADMSDQIALVHHALGNDAQTFEVLEKAAANHSWQLQFIATNPGWDDLRNAPRFQAILRKMNLVK
jgi:TolB-like protein